MSAAQVVTHLQSQSTRLGDKESPKQAGQPDKQGWQAPYSARGPASVHRWRVLLDPSRDSTDIHKYIQETLHTLINRTKKIRSHACNHNIWEAEAGGSGIRGQLLLSISKNVSKTNTTNQTTKWCFLWAGTHGDQDGDSHILLSYLPFIPKAREAPNGPNILSILLSGR